MSVKKEFGDFQTPDYLAADVTALVDEIFGTPKKVVEPTAGLGAFLKASIDQWGQNCQYEGYEINREYVELASKHIKATSVKLFNCDFFSENWKHNLNNDALKKVLVIGNPPWVTNSYLGSLGSQNLPKKSNFQGLRGFDAQTGKSNFDIAEWMLIKLIEALPPEGAVAMLCKTMTARKVLKHLWKTAGGREGARIFHIDAKAAFGVVVDACLFMITGQINNDRTAIIYDHLDINSNSTQFGLIDGDLVSDITAYNKHRDFAGGTSSYRWRSGIKHDASKVMEFAREGDFFRNGLGELVELENEFVYPLLKSSDLGNGQIHPRKFVIVTQSHIVDDTSAISSSAPKTWEYLITHAEALDKRRSSIYRNRPRFSIFGIGRYSFAPWKVAISGLYKSFAFIVVPPYNNRPVLVDDTCYSIPCHTEEEANLLCDLLSSEPALEFLRSLVFTDSKRPITIDVLRRISLVSIAQCLGRLNELQKCIHSRVPYEKSEQQMLRLMDPK